jgi:hypothetical protein
VREPAEADAAVTLAVTVDGRTSTLSDDDWLALDILAVQGDEGRGARDAVPLRALAVHVAGPGARVTRVIGAGEEERVLARAAWEDVARVPVLRLNRRGRFKFHWMGADLAPLPGDDVRHVERLVIESEKRDAPSGQDP